MYAFSDGSPVQELAAAIALLVFGIYASKAWFPRALSRWEARLAAWLRGVGLFDRSSVRAEIFALDILRIPLAAILLFRLIGDFELYLGSAQWGMSAWIGLGLLFDLALLAGFATPVAAAGLALCLNLIIDNFTFNPSLGSMAVAIALIPMVVGPAGYSLSADSLLMARPTLAGRLIRWIYGLWGRPTVDRIQIGRFMALVAYAAINAYSALKHLESSTWSSGFTTGFLLMSPIVNPGLHKFFYSFYEYSPKVYVYFSLFSTYGMIFWQIFLLPLALISRWTRIVAIIWGLIFFLFSTEVMAIKTLGHYEYILWALIFWNGAQLWLTRAASFIQARMRFDWLSRFLVRGRIRYVAPRHSFVGHGIAVAFAICALAYVARFPAVAAFAGNVPQSVSKAFLGQAPLVFVMGPIDVFNELDMRVYRNKVVTNYVYPSGEVEETTWNVDLYAESQRSVLTAELRKIALKPIFCGFDYSRVLIDIARGTLARNPKRLSATLQIDFMSFDRPNMSDFQARRHVGLIGEVVCRIQGAVDGAGQLSVEFFPAGRQKLAELGVPADLSSEQHLLVERFPCAEETSRVAHWFDKAIDSLRSDRELQAFLKLLAINGGAEGSLACFGAYEAIARLMNLDDPGRIPLKRMTCLPDLAAARAYMPALALAVRAQALELVGAAEHALRDANVAGCIRQSAAVRALYFANLPAD